MTTKKSNGDTAANTNDTEDTAKRPKQTAIPGTERKVHGDVTEAAETYVGFRDKRMKLTEKESESKEALMVAMKKHGLTDYVDEEAELVVEIVATEETVKVRKYDPEKEAKKAAKKAAEAEAEA